nr:hypothetical protein CFP56_02699 [Quercus suber]
MYPSVHCALRTARAPAYSKGFALALPHHCRHPFPLTLGTASATGPTGSSEAAIAIPQIQCDCFSTQAARGRAGSRQPFDNKLMPARCL